MNMFALLDYAQNQEMQLVLLFVEMTVVGVGACLLVRWFGESTVRPDPWDEQVKIDLEREDARPLCHRCLEPHDPLIYFCPNCGAPVGEYTNWLPFPQLFSVGDQLRLGTTGEFRHDRANVFGFLLLSVAEYWMFAPIYWFLFFRHLGHAPPATPSPPASTEPTG